MTMISCGPDEPDTPGGGGNGGNGGGQTESTTVAVTGVSVSKSSLSLTEGESETLTAIVSPDNATNKAVSWKSSAADIATVDGSGKVTAVKAGSATRVYFGNMSVAPNGEIYLTCHIRDSFNQDYLSMYKLSGDGSVTEVLIGQNRIARPDIGVTDEGDVYILAANYDAGKESWRLFKNGKLDKVIDQVETNLESCLRCVGNDVYTVINDETNRQIRVHKNGTEYQTLDYSQEVYLRYASGDTNPSWVNADGDVYLSVLENGSLCRVYKNGKIIYSCDATGELSMQPFRVIE